MANTLTGLIPILYQALNVVSREDLGFIRSVGRDSSADMVALGQPVRTPIVGNYAAADVTPGVTAPDTGDQEVEYVTTTISKSRAVPVRWNGEEMMGTALVNDIIVDQFAEAFRTLTTEIETDVALAAKAGSSRAVGTAGTAPFGTAGNLSDFANVRKVLRDNGAPSTDLYLALDSVAIATMQSLQANLFRVNEAADESFLREGELTKVYGLAPVSSSGIALHTKGTGTSYDTNGGEPVGETEVVIDTGTGTILAGDVVTFDGDTNNYVVKEDGTTTLLTLNKPGLQQVLGDGVDVTIGDNYTPNVGFHKRAIQLVTRAPAMPAGGDGATDVMDLFDPKSGLTFQVAMYRQYRQVHIEIGIAWGQSIIKPEHIVTLMG